MSRLYYPPYTTVKLRRYTAPTAYTSPRTSLVNTGHPLLSLLINHIVLYPTPANLSYLWSFGSIAGLLFTLQIITGIILVTHYTPFTAEAFKSVEHIMRQDYLGYYFRYGHANGASFIFVILYLHMARGLYVEAYLTRIAVWNTGVVILLLMMGTAFIGYVLPWGQMSFWGATVITNLVTALPLIGEDLAFWIWGGFSVTNVTLQRFFSVHFLLPFVLVGVIMIHLLFLHRNGSTDPLRLPYATYTRVSFAPYFAYKDAVAFGVFMLVYVFFVMFHPNVLGHVDNFEEANPLKTPAHIVPEWYFTPFYAILRSCPDKLGGVISMFVAIVILIFMTVLYSSFNLRVIFGSYNSFFRTIFRLFIILFVLLLQIGSSAAAYPYTQVGILATVLYFAWIIGVLPMYYVLSKRVYHKFAKINLL